MSAEAPPRPVRTSPAPAGASPASRLSRWNRFDLHGSPYVFIAPFFVLFAMFGFFPLVYTAWVSLRAWDLTGDGGFVGLGNYSRLMGDPDFWNAVLNTLGLFVLATVPQLLMALVIAALLNRPIRALLMFRLAVLAPIVTSVAAVAIVFGQLYGRDTGMVNGVLGLIGVDAIDWQASKTSSWIAVASMVNWRWTGYNALIYLAAMQAIPRDLYEAAQLDGAGAVRQFRSVTVPLIRPALVFTVVMSTIGGMQLFTEPLLFGQGDVSGGSLRQFQTVAMYMFEQSFQNFDYGYGSAIAWTIFVLTVIAGVVNALISRRLRGGTR
ncbi:sugar ABC transporter permease [Kribbella turkmenica]|uniref:Sugar ABC transporter permease n=1 Tax=Kribbella turkmenica TaxID=2530375 RepID=A0A4V6PD66_9ACTN|nr:sugar ABC transporter permease [Kribbella turkmenica]TDD23607.1 sugar ABC transporter permease [Kribbella turkmenica]